MADSDLLFFPPREIQEVISQPIEPAAGSSGLLMSAMEKINDPLLSNPPFCLRDAT
jgi:hypothetical protein